MDQSWSARQRSGAGRQQELALTAGPGTSLRRLPLGWRAPTPPAAIEIALDPARRIASERRVTYEWVEDVARHVGTIVHEYLRRFAEDGLGNWRSPRIEDERPTIESELRRLGTAAVGLHRAVDRVIQALYNVNASEQAKWLFARRTETHCEWPVSGFLNGQLLNATIDLTFVDDEGTRWIVDYKTSSHEGGGLEGFLDEQQRRYRPQLESYAALLRLQDARPIRLGIYFPLLDEWRSWAYEEAAASEVTATGTPG